jgi:hypothetical protein
MEVLRFTCSRCNRPLGCGLERAGQPGRCPECEHTFLAPSAMLGMGGRLEAGEDYRGGDGEVVEAFDDEGAFGALTADKAIEEKRKEKERRTEVGRERKKSKWRRRFEKAALVLVLAAGVLLVMNYIWSTWKSRSTEAAEIVPIAEDTDVVGEEARMARETVIRFLDAEEFEARAALVRDAERVRPLMREYYGRRGFGAEPYRRLIDQAETGGGWMYFDMDGLQYLLVEMEDYTVRVLVVEQTEEGVKIDWESWVIYGEMEWADFKTKRPTELVLMRPIVSSSDYYNFHFADREKWSCYRLSDPRIGGEVYGYAEKDSENDLKLAGLIARKGTAWPVVKLRWPAEGRSDRQVEIVEILSDRWVMD